MAVSVAVRFSKFDERGDRVETGVLCERPGDDFKGGCKSLNGHLFTSSDGFGIGPQVAGNRCEHASASGEDGAIFPSHRDDADGVIKRSTNLIDDVFRAAAEKNGNRLSFRAAGDEGHVRITDFLFLHA